jgi:hypothetical protein
MIKERKNKLSAVQIIQYVVIYGLLISALVFGILCIVYSRLLEGSIICIAVIVIFFMMLYMMSLDYKANTLKIRKNIGTQMFSVLNAEHWFDADHVLGDIIFSTNGLCIKNSSLIDGQGILSYSDVSKCDIDGDVTHFKFKDNSSFSVKVTSDNKRNAIYNYISDKFLKNA